MQIIDLSQIMISAIFGSKRELDCTIDDLRAMMLFMIRNINSNFRRHYGTLVIAADGKAPYWRKEIFPHYKGNRKKLREKSDVDWDAIHEVVTQFKTELKENFPYKFIEIDHVEADDIIAVLCQTYQDEEIMIVSSDKDYFQLNNENIKQYDPINDRYIHNHIDESPSLYLAKHVIKGDRGDGIPNILSDDDTFMVEGKRQKTIGKNKLDDLVSLYLAEGKIPEHEEKLARNITLIDLNHIPPEVKQKIVDVYSSVVPASRNDMRKYFGILGLTGCSRSIGEF